MEENITKTSLEKLKKQNDLFFQIDYIKSKTFKELIYNIFNLFIPNYINSILMFELASQVAEKIHTTPAEIYESYSKIDKNDLKVFQKSIKQIIYHINKANENMLKICELIRK